MKGIKRENIVKSVSVVFLLSLIASLLSFICEMMFANSFGVSEATDAFTIASQIPVILFSVVTASISTTVVPLYSREVQTKTKEEAQQFISKFVTLVAIVSIGIVIIEEIIAPFIINIFSPGINDTTFAYAVRFIRILFPTVVFTGIMSAFMGVLQVHKAFGKSNILMIIRECVYAIFIIVLSKTIGIYAAIFGLLIASFIEFLFSYVFVSSKVKVKPNFHFKDKRILEALRMSLPIFLGIGAAEINRLVDKIVASFLPAGNISMLNYASKLSDALTSLIVGAISTVMFPYFADLAVKKDKEGLSKTFFITMDAYVFLTIPIVIGGMILSQSIVEVAFMRGAFSQKNANFVAYLFAGYLFSMLFAAIRQTGAKLFYAEGNTKTPMINTIIGIIVNIVLNFVLGYYLGAFGLVLATVISTALIAILLLVSARKYLIADMWKGFFLSLFKSLISGLGMAIVLILVSPIMNKFGTFLSLILSVLLGMVIYGVLLYTLGKKEIKNILNIVSKKAD